MEELEMELLKVRFANNPRLIGIYQTIRQADALIDLKTEDIAVLQGTGAIQSWQVTLHLNAKRYVERTLQENADFLNLPIEDKVGKLEEMAKQATPAPQGTATDILKIANAA
jgi:hypothetical protein